MSLGLVRINLGTSRTHGSSYIHVPHPFPILWQSQLLRTSLHLNMLIVAQEADFGHCIFIKFLCFTYFFQKSWTHFFPKLLATSQDNLATKALFKSFVFMIPIPPAYLERHIESQVLKNNPCFFSSIPRQKFLLILSSFLQIDFDKRREDMW